uniref:Growth differentiation factor 2 n=1 Tax=Neogobius melanostomus TaxID=47308 RepID=A0A8C6WMC5_9GOBI
MGECRKFSLKMLSITPFLLQFCLSFVVSSGSCKPLFEDVETEDSEGLYSQLTEEEDTKTRIANLLGTMKEDFLRKLNLSDVPQEKNMLTPPQFMMELYNKYASDNSVIPQSDVIRSFTLQDITQNVANGNRRKHRLMFNITIPSYEKITAAELQLFFQPETRANISSHSFRGTVKVYEVDTTQLVFGKEVSSVDSMWETFDVTTSIQSWIKSGSEVSGFDVVVETEDCIKYTGDCFTMSGSVGDNTSAALIVFSDYFGSRRQEAKKELKEMIIHEEESILHSDSVWEKNKLPMETNEAQHPRRKKRKAEREYCRRTSLKVNFKDIGWDSWIVAPPEYDAFECRGLCYHPLTDESTPSKHALIQTLMNIRNPKKANMACCVPIKLDPITVMYQENGRLTIRYMYEEMKVAECGCR